MWYHGYRTEDVMVLRDDTTNPRKLPTRRNMIAAMKWLVEGAQKDDSLFFHYSGHGSQTPDEDGDEIDGYDEVIFPTDYKKRGHIVDDEMFRIMVRPLPAGCRLTALFDVRTQSTHRVEMLIRRSPAIQELSSIFLMWCAHAYYTPSGRKKGIHVTSRALQRKSSRADVISWSGCKDDQKSTDTFQGGQAVGAMSYAFINSLKRNPHVTYQHLLKCLNDLLYSRFNQSPQLGSSHHIDTNLQFVI
ncbi:Ca(2+)-dependent cysteine protease [Marasmius crinis-equi]|uniref:Ca(2+)-dependent cysteine protease n=1 Tax=Marasmius crinis-equi TaxID=585013 RepID=A0ABR3EWA1_9AGAR